MMFGSVCSGIEAASVAWQAISWKAAFVSEIEAFPCAVLKHHYPDVPNHGDMTKFKDWPDHAIDLLVGGTPCQSFSVAGLRKGMADPRGNLALTFLAIADRYRPEWLLWENVPGVLSSNGGRDFGSFLGGLAELGYGFAYRVLDAQYVRVESHPRAVPQRRRRVFVVGNLRGWQRAAAVLFERQSLSGDSPPRREAGKGTSASVAPSLVSSGRGVERGGDSRGQDPVIAELVANSVTGDARHAFPEQNRGTLLAFDGQSLSDCGDTSATLDTGAAHTNRGMHVAQALRGEGFDASEDGTGRGVPLVAATIGTQMRGYAEPNMNNLQAVAFDTTQITSPGNYSVPKAGDPCHPLAASAHVPAVAFQSKASASQSMNPSTVAPSIDVGKSDGLAVATQYAVRRLTPLECERLQGFPDNYTAVPYRGKIAADGPRYKALGNSMAVNCMSWLGERIEAAHHHAVRQQ